MTLDLPLSLLSLSPEGAATIVRGWIEGLVGSRLRKWLVQLTVAFADLFKSSAENSPVNLDGGCFVFVE